MTQQTINIGTSANDGTGDPARTAFDKVNDNFTELYGAPVLTGTAATDTDAFQAWVTAQGANAVLNLRPNTTLTLDKGIQLLAGQKLRGNGATITRVNQVATTTDTDVTSGVTTSITVASATGLRAGQSIVLQTGAATNFSSARTISSVVGTTVTVSSAFDITSTNQLNVYLVFTSIYGADDVEITGVNFDGNRANWTFNRWQSTTEIRPYGQRVRIHGNTFTDIPCECIQESALSGGTTINAGANAITAGGTTATVASASGLAVGDYVLVSTTTTAAKTEPLAHRITDITGSVITIEAPGWWFAESSGSLDVNKVAAGNQYADNVFQNVGGNPVHLSGSTGTIISRNHALNVNLDADAGHRGGLISWSYFCNHAVVTDNYVNGSYCGIGNLDGIHASGALIANNVVENATTYGLLILNALTTPYCTRDVKIIGNTFRNCVQVYAYNSGSTTDPLNYVTNLQISNNHFYKTNLHFQRVADSVVGGNYFYAPGDWTDSATMCVKQFQVSRVLISGNDFVGGYYGVAASAAWTHCTISGNVFSQQYQYPINTFSTSDVGTFVQGNKFFNDSSANSAYAGVYTPGPAHIVGNYFHLVAGYGVRIPANTPNVVIKGNTIKAPTYSVRIDSGSTAYFIVNNSITTGFLDTPAVGTLRDNDTVTVA